MPIERTTLPSNTVNPATQTALAASRNYQPVMVATNCFMVGSATSAQTTAGTSRVPHKAGIACTDIRLVFTNAYSAGSLVDWADADGPGDYPISASVEVGGTIYRVTFGGQTVGTVGPGGAITSDPLPVDLAAGDVFYSRTYINSTNWRANKASYDASGTGGRTTTDLTAPGSGSVADSIGYQYAPCAIIGRPRGGITAVAPVIVGDSIDNGQSAHGSQAECHGYSTTQPGHNYFWDLALQGLAGWASIAKSGDQAQKFVLPAGHFRRAGVLRFATHALCGYGRNDITAGRTLSQIQADLISCWRITTDRGLKTWQRTITPTTTSTDSWATTANQTAEATATIRNGLNQWLRAGAPMSAGAAVAIGTSGALVAGSSGHPLTGVIDVATAVETAQDSGIWKAAYTADGVHPLAAGQTAMTAAVTASALLS